MTVEQIRSETRADLEIKLECYGKCCLIRPTGFGKTWLVTDLIRSYNRVLYVAPTVAIMNTVVDVFYGSEECDSLSDEETIHLAKALKQFEHVDMITYMKIQSLSKQEIENLPDYDLIVFDEAHIMGATGASKVIKKLINKFSDSHIVGATATPNRMDGFDIVGEFFNNIVVTPYTLHDAFHDKLLKKPAYYYCTYNLEDIRSNALEDATTELFSAGISKQTCKREDIQTLLKSAILHESQIFNMDNMIRAAAKKYLKGSYFKFICFFPDVSKIEEQGNQVKGWFQSAFPSYSINILQISSKDSQTRQNVYKLDQLTQRKNCIDLIFCVNMINVGYHVNDLSGVLMYRGTQSNIVYIQQLGRALSSGSKHPCIVFDVVDNLHRKALYDMQTGPVYSSHSVEVTDAVLQKLSPDQIAKLRDSDLRCRVELHDSEYVVLSNQEHYNEATHSIEKSWWLNANRVYKEDLYALGHEATYRELIAKAVAEPISYLCREAVNLHFKRWCRDNSINYPISKKYLKKLYGVPESEWRNQFKEVIEANGFDYPWQDAEKIMRCAAVPLEVFAREKEVSIPRILELLGVA